MKFTVGQKLWFVHKHGSGFEVTITRVGTKWLGCHRRQYTINTDTLTVFAGDEPCGQCYPSREVWAEQISLCNLRTKFRAELELLPIDTWTIDDIRAAAKLLKIDLGEQKGN